MSEQFAEYVVEVPGRGYVNTWTGFGDTLVDIPPDRNTWRDHLTLARAEEALSHTRERYERMGCPEIAETARIVSRVVTVERGDWSTEDKIYTDDQGRYAIAEAN